MTENNFNENVNPDKQSALKDVTLDELLDTVYPPKTPVIEGLLYAGTYLFVGAPKIGKSFLMAQLGIHVSKGIELWDYKVHKGEVLYLALEDDYARLQRRISQMYGVEGTDKFHLVTEAPALSEGLDSQLEIFLKEYPDCKLIIIDTLQKVRKARELVIMLPPSFQEYDPDALLKLFVLKFHNEYGLHCHAGLHHNKAESNYHIHLVYSERKLLEQPEHKIATRNMFYDENGKHRRTKKEILDENGDIRPGCKIISKGEEYDFKFFGPKEERVGSPGFTKELKHMFTDLINELCKEESEKLTVFDRNGPYLATKKIGKNNPMAEQIKADNEARQEWNRAVDEARASGIPEEDIVSMKKELVSSEIKESIKANGFMPELLGKILKKAVDALKSKIKSFKLPEKKIPVFDFENYNKMVKVNKKLQKIIADIKVIDSKVEHKLQKSNECQGIKYRKFKITLLKEIGELNVQRGEKTSELSKIVRDAGYKDVNQFMKAFEKSCRLLEEYQKASEDKIQDDPKEKESVLSKLKAYEEEAKHRPSKSKSKHKDSQEL